MITVTTTEEREMIQNLCNSALKHDGILALQTVTRVLGSIKVQPHQPKDEDKKEGGKE